MYLTSSILLHGASLEAQSVKSLSAMQKTWASIPASRRSPGEGNGNPLQYSCLGNPMDRATWWATVHGFAESDRTCFKMTELHFLLRCVLPSPFKVLLMNLLRVNYLDHFQQIHFLSNPGKGDLEEEAEFLWQLLVSQGIVSHHDAVLWNLDVVCDHQAF